VGSFFIFVKQKFVTPQGTPIIGNTCYKKSQEFEKMVFSKIYRIQIPKNRI